MSLKFITRIQLFCKKYISQNLWFFQFI